MALTVNNLIMVRCSHTIGDGLTESYTMMRAATAVDFVINQTGGANRSVQLANSGAGTAISAALTPGGAAVALRTASPGVWTAANKDLVAGDTLDFIVSVDDMGYQAYAYLYPTPGAVT
jgi:hypothetical protein